MNADVYRSQRSAHPHLHDNGSLHEICSIDTDVCPVNITGDVIALIDDASKMHIYNWKIDQGAYLDDTSDSEHDHYIQVVFTLTTILVVPARYIAVYTVPLA